jgi:hypothetical protein
LASVAKTTAEMLGMSYEEILQMLSTNWCNFVNQKL